MMKLIQSEIIYVVLKKHYFYVIVDNYMSENVSNFGFFENL